MKRSEFTEQQIAYALKQAELGTPVEEVCRKMGIADATFYNWKKKYGGLGPSEVRRLKQLEACPCCGYVSKDNRQTQAKFLCADCGYENHADVVGAINVLERGYRFLACGEPVQSDCAVKQEPTEAIAQIAA